MTGCLWLLQVETGYFPLYLTVKDLQDTVCKLQKYVNNQINTYKIGIANSVEQFKPYAMYNAWSDLSKYSNMIGMEG